MPTIKTKIQGVLEALLHVIGEVEAAVHDYRDALDPVPLFEPVRFHCARCGACCVEFIPGVSVLDIRAFIEKGLHEPLAFVVPHENRHSFRFMTAAEANEITRNETSILSTWLRSLESSIEQQEEEIGDACVFYHVHNHACSIHEWKPLECRLFPAGNILLGLDEEITCPAVCFEQGTIVDPESTRSMMGKKRVADHAIAMLLAHDRSGGPWHDRFTRISALLEELRVRLSRG